MEESLSTQIKQVNELHNKDMLETILLKMQPLIKKYSRKLYFLDKDDAFQELNLALIEAIYHLKTYKNDAMCLAYLQKSVINKYNYLCKKNIKMEEYINNLSEMEEENMPLYRKLWRNRSFYFLR